MPLSLSRLERLVVYIVTDVEKKQYDQSKMAKSMQRMAFDMRIHFKVAKAADNLNANQIARNIFLELMQGENKFKNSGVVWIRNNVVLADYFFAERLLEAWSESDNVVLMADNKPMVWGISSKAIKKMHLKFNTNAADSKNTLPLWPVLEGEFPIAEINLFNKNDVPTKPVILDVAVDDGIPALEKDGFLMKGLNTIKPQFLTKPPTLFVVTASRESQESFLSTTLLGQSLSRMKALGIDIKLQVACNNVEPLTKIYNKGIADAPEDSIVLFIHDDVWIDDAFLAYHLEIALKHYDLIGVAGNKNRYAHQPAWAFPKNKQNWDTRENRLGAVSHDVKGAPASQRGSVSVYGAYRGPARLVDGVLLAAYAKTLKDSEVKFDEKFTFHLYDMDFCRAAENAGLRIGVWPLAITHASGGNFSSTEWYAGFGTYIGKWGS